jgi:hypothetical protein
MIDNYTFRLYREDNTLVQAEEQNYTGRFTIDASVLNQVGRNGRAEITATSSCDTTSPVTQSVAINIHPEVKIQSLFVNSINDDVAVRLGEPVVLEMTAVENGNPERFLCSINNDIWELGSVYIDYPVNPKTYEVLLTDESGVCSDKRLVNVVAVNPLPNAVISPENPNYAQYEEESLAAGKPTWISVIGDWKVYNRYGQEVFSQESTAEMPTVIWAGQDNDENALPAGSYFYIYTTPKGDAERGTVEVIK